MPRFRKLSAVTSPLIGITNGDAVSRLFSLVVMLFSLLQPAAHAQETSASSASLPSQSTDGTFDPKDISPLVQRRSPWELTNPQPLPDNIVKNSIEPLVWVKIPKGFAGVWETRKKLIQVIGSYEGLNDMPLSPSEIAEHVKQDRLVGSEINFRLGHYCYGQPDQNAVMGKDKRSLWMQN